jgi:hypothetical protein
VTCSAPACTAPDVAIVRLSLPPLEGYADPDEGHTRFTVCTEHLAVVERHAAAGNLGPLVRMTVTTYGP